MTEKPPLAIWGSSGHAMVVADIVRLQGEFSIIGFLDDVNSDRHRTEFQNALVIGGSEQLRSLFDQGVKHILLGFGDCRKRLELTVCLQSMGFSLPIAVHPSAVLADDAILGPGTVIAAGAIVNPGVKIGSSVIINTSSSVDHECIIDHAVHICPGVHLAGRVVVGQATQVGIGSVVNEKVRIGEKSIVGAGSVVISDVPDNVVAYGVPARVVRRVSE